MRRDRRTGQTDRKVLTERKAMAEPFLSIQQVRKAFGATTVVQDFNLDVE
ncbi:MAG: peptide ABC transporter ATP-binding protein, partial [Mesorhizobium sp.]